MNAPNAFLSLFASITRTLLSWRADARHPVVISWGGCALFWAVPAWARDPTEGLPTCSVFYTVFAWIPSCPTRFGDGEKLTPLPQPLAG